MKPFDLEAAKRGEPILCAGIPCKFIVHIPDAKEDYRVIVKVDGGSQDGAIWLYREDGRISAGSEKPSLTMAPKPKIKREGWVTIGARKDCDGMPWVGGIFKSKQNAESRRIEEGQIVRIEWEEDAE